MTTARATTKRTKLPLRIHRWLSVGAAVFWLIQALTGLLIVFHWEMNDAAISDLQAPTDLAAIEARIESSVTGEPGGTMTSIWTTAGTPDRYVLYFKDAAGESAAIRIAGDGTILHRPAPDESGFFSFLIGIHHDLLGEWGSLIVSISGLLLCSNLILGLIAAWPKKGGWRSAIVPTLRGGTRARLYSWHRALGLWVVIPAFVVAATGTMLKWEEDVADLVGAEDVALPPVAPAGDPQGFAVVAGTALGALPGSTLTQVAWPSEEDATYRIRVRAPGEIRRAYGASVVLVNANDGAIRGVFPIAEAEPARAFMSSLFPIHTGEAGGLVGRLLMIAVGLWLITMIVAGLLLWWKRRPKGRAAQ